ncbi:hypothetical protein F5B17DRAFT_394334 [Nemania serpens]|nr:hypothetical protein F5B17DRAFT_394334 [Nemania serpens]
MTDYAATYPTNIAVDERVKRFISAFYDISDTPSRNDDWVDCFAPDALLVVGHQRARGVEEIRRLREGMWDQVRSRRHRLGKVFPAAFESPERKPEDEGEGEGEGRRRRFEYMLHGSVELELKSGERLVREWAGRAVLTVTDGEEGGLRYGFYQVYLV